MSKARRNASPPPLAFQKLNNAFLDLTLKEKVRVPLTGGSKSPAQAVTSTTSNNITGNNGRPLSNQSRSSTFGKLQNANTRQLDISKLTKDLVQVKETDIITDIGRRPYMEDMSISMQLNERFYCAFVFDGHNGAKASSYLKDGFTKLLPEILKPNVDYLLVPDIMKSIVEKLSKDFKRKKVIDGSTISGVVLDLNYALIHVATLGDSQTMISGVQGKVNYISHRDSTDLLEERQRLAEAGFIVEKENNAAMWRLFGLNMTKAFGNYYTGALDDALSKTNGRSLHVHSLVLPKTQQNASIIIASDGLFDELSPEHLAEVPILRKMNLKSLMKLVKEEGYKGDNTTMIKLNINRVKTNTTS